MTLFALFDDLIMAAIGCAALALAILVFVGFDWWWQEWRVPRSSFDEEGLPLK